MQNKNIILARSYNFALAIMKLCVEIRAEKEFELASQMWRAGTSIGANVEEAQAAQSRADFKSKMSIAAKEAREIHYWLRLTQDGDILPAERVADLIEEISELKRILTSIVMSSGK
jgi:four helix bundle protein